VAAKQTEEDVVMAKVVEIPTDQKVRHQLCTMTMGEWAAKAEDEQIEMVAVAVVVVARDGVTHTETVSDGYRAPLLGALDICKDAILKWEG